MRNLLALIVVIALMPGCCLVGMTVGGARASAHNDEVARKLERGEPLDDDDQEQSVGAATLKGFAIGGLVDVAAVTAFVCVAVSSFSLASSNPGPSGWGYVSDQD